MPGKSKSLVPIEQIDGMIRTLRGARVILDSDLAKIYGVPTFRFNEAIKRNRHRFPTDFMFQLTRAEFDSLKSQIAMSKTGRGGRRTLPNAFTEHGALQAANVLRSPRAVQMSVFVIRAFVKMREALRGTPELARKLAALEKKLTARLDVHEAAIVRQDVSVSRLAIIPLPDLWDIFRDRLENPPERRLERIGEINVGQLQQIGRNYKTPTQLTVEPKPEDWNRAHAEIPQKITRGLANKVVDALKIHNPPAS